MSTVLLVDDEHDTLELFTEILEQMNHRVLGARDGQEALRLAREAKPDLVVTDWMMPRMNGVELCQRMHEDVRLREIPIILHSSESNPNAPGVRFVPKDCPLEEFEGLVRRLLASTQLRRSGTAHENARSLASSPSPHQVHPMHQSHRTQRPSPHFSQEREALCSTAH